MDDVLRLLGLCIGGMFFTFFVFMLLKETAAEFPRVTLATAVSLTATLLIVRVTGAHPLMQRRNEIEGIAILLGMILGGIYRLRSMRRGIPL